MSTTTRRPADGYGNLFWVLVWLVLIVTGASTTSVIRAPISDPRVVPALAAVHRYVGGAVAAAFVILLSRGSGRQRFAALLVGATAVSGLSAGRSFAPSTAAAHAWLAAMSAAMLAVTAGAAVLSTKTPPGWLRTTARVGLVLMALQSALGASLRHQLVSLGSHLLVAGLASVAVLVPAVTTLQAPSADGSQHAAARWAVAATLLQLSLGILIVLMMAVGNPAPWAWISTTVAHVTVGAVTVLTTAKFVAALGGTPRRNGALPEPSGQHQRRDNG